MDEERAATWPYGLSSQALWGQPGPPGQRSGTAPLLPVQGSWQPWVYYHHHQQQYWGPYSGQPGLTVLEYLLIGGGPAPGQAPQHPGGPYSSKPGQTLQFPGGPYSRGPGEGLQFPGGPYSSSPGQALQLSGGPYSSGHGQGLQLSGGPYNNESGLCLQQPPEIQQPGAFYNGKAGLSPQLAPGPYNVVGFGPGGQYSPGLDLHQPGPPYTLELQPGEPYPPDLGSRESNPQQAGPFGSPQNKKPGYESGLPEQGWAWPPMNVEHSRNYWEEVSTRSTSTLGNRNDQSSASTEPKQENNEHIFIIKQPKLSLQRLPSLKVEPFPIHCSVQTIQAALQDMFGKFGEITSIQVNGKGDERSAMVFYKFVKDRNSALLGTQGTSLFNTKIYVTVWPCKKTQSYTDEMELAFFAEEGSSILYINNLEKDVSRDDLSNTFTCFGEIIDTEIQRLPGPYNYGVVLFSYASQVLKVISQMNGLFLSRTKLKEKFGDSVSTNCIFLHDLLKTSFTVQHLVHHFCQFGTLEKVLLNRFSGKALVAFKDDSSAEKAIQKMREGSDGHLLTGDYAHREFVARFYYSFKMRWKDTRGFALVFGEPNEHGANILAKENETQILAGASEVQDILVAPSRENAADMLAKVSEEEEADMLAEASEEEAGMLEAEEDTANMLAEAGEEEGADILAEAKQAADMLANASEEANMLAEASEEEEADILEEDGEEKTESLVEVGDEHEEVAPLLDLSEELEVSSDSGEEAAEPLPELDEKITPAFADAVK